MLEIYRNIPIILTLLEEHRDGPLRPKEIVSLLHKDVRTVTKLLFDMSRDSHIRLLGRGQYMTIKSFTSSDSQQSQAHLAYLDKLHQILSSNSSNPNNPSNEGNIGNDGNDSDHSGIGNDSNHSHSASTSLPDLPSHSPLAPNTLNPPDIQPFSPIDTASFLSNHPFKPQ